jgi:hypothetical protein
LRFSGQALVIVGTQRACVTRTDLAFVFLLGLSTGIVDKLFKGPLDLPIPRRLDRFAPAPRQ